MKINKKFLSSIAAIMILIYHVWTLVTGSYISRNILGMFYAGVDIFFFVSAYSLADKKIDYLPFIGNRIMKVYLKFIFLAAVFAIYRRLGFLDFILTAIGVNFFLKGGASFLWFGPAIMITYLTYPLFTGWKFKHKGLVVLGIWAVLGILISTLTDYRAIFIFWNRIPVILLGYYAKKIMAKVPRSLGFVLLPIGCLCLYFIGVKYPLSTPIVDLFYISAIPLVLGLALLSGYIKDCKLTNFLSSFTFELYGVQVIFAVDLVTELLYLLDITMVVNILSIAIFLAAGYFFHLLWQATEHLIIKKSK